MTQSNADQDVGIPKQEYEYMHEAIPLSEIDVDRIQIEAPGPKKFSYFPHRECKVTYNSQTPLRISLDGHYQIMDDYRVSRGILGRKITIMDGHYKIMDNYRTNGGILGRNITIILTKSQKEKMLEIFYRFRILYVEQGLSTDRIDDSIEYFSTPRPSKRLYFVIPNPSKRFYAFSDVPWDKFWWGKTMNEKIEIYISKIRASPVEAYLCLLMNAHPLLKEEMHSELQEQIHETPSFNLTEHIGFIC